MTTPTEAARQLGSMTSPAKTAAARENGRKGGRPATLFDSGPLDATPNNRHRFIVRKTSSGISVKWDNLYSDDFRGTEYYYNGNFPNIPATDSPEAWYEWKMHLDMYHTPDRTVKN